MERYGKDTDEIYSVIDIGSKKEALPIKDSLAAAIYAELAKTLPSETKMFPLLRSNGQIDEIIIEINSLELTIQHFYNQEFDELLFLDWDDRRLPPILHVLFFANQKRLAEEIKEFCPVPDQSRAIVYFNSYDWEMGKQILEFQRGKKKIFAGIWVNGAIRPELSHKTNYKALKSLCSKSDLAWKKLDEMQREL